MVYAKSNRRYRRKRMPRRRYNNKTYSMAKKALYLAKKNASTIETKYFDVDATATASTAPSIFTNGYTWALSQVTAGTSNNQRIGNQISPTSLRIRFNYDESNSILASSNGIQTYSNRIIVFSWKSESPSYSAFNTYADVLEDAALNSFKSETNRYESKILYDRTFFQANSDVQVMPNEIIIKKLPKHIFFEDTSALNARNGLYLMIISTNSSEATPVCSFKSRLFYKDA